MSRVSSDVIDSEGIVVSGFDYDRQCWIIDYIVRDCGHPRTMDCGCYGREHKGQDIRVLVVEEAV